MDDELRDNIATVKRALAKELMDEDHYHAIIYDNDGNLICFEDGCQYYNGDEGEGTCKEKECPYPDGPRIDKKVEQMPDKCDEFNCNGPCAYDEDFTCSDRPCEFNFDAEPEIIRNFSKKRVEGNG